MRLTVIGAGYVGLTSALVFGSLGHEVVCVERDPKRLGRLRLREDPLGEPGLDDLLRSSSVRFVDADPDIDRARLVLIAVGTPMRYDGHADLTHVYAACRPLAYAARPGTVVAIRSTVPVGTCDHLQADLLPHQLVVSNPEFLREGRALEDTLSPTRIVAGGPAEARAVIDELYAPLLARAPLVPLLWMTSRSAELAKYAANGFLATKLSFANEIANLAETVGADGLAVLRSMGLDPRIGPGHLRPGLGWGGSCFPKDTRALAALASGEGYDFLVLKAAIDQNNRQLEEFALAIERETAPGATIALLGLAFKAGTADTRESPAVALAGRLTDSGRQVHAFDPAVRQAPAGVTRLDPTPLAACAGADAVVIATEWPEFCTLDLAALRAVMRGDLLFDGRAVVDPAHAALANFHYRAPGGRRIEDWSETGSGRRFFAAPLFRHI